MKRTTIIGLAAFDAFVAAAIGLVGILAPLALMWLVLFGDIDVWNALWPTSVRVWQLGHLVPVHLDLGETAHELGIDEAASSFWLGLPPLLFGAFSFLFAVRSGHRAVRSGAPWIAAGSGVLVAVLAAIAAQLTSENPVASVYSWQAMLFPPLIYAFGMLGGIVHGSWNDGDGGPLDRLHDLVDEWGPAWREAPALMLRGAAVVVIGLVGAAGALFAVGVALHGDDIIGLYEAAQPDAVGATVLTLAQFAYIPTIVVWLGSWISGAGFSIGAGTAISPSATTVGVLPGVPVLGILPEGSHWWMLLSVLVPVALGALGGWAVRRTYANDWAHDGQGEEPYAPRAAIAAGIAVASAVSWAVLAAVASGALGPGRLADVGASALTVAVTVGLEALIGAGIMLLAPMPKPLSEADWDALTDEDA